MPEPAAGTPRPLLALSLLLALAAAAPARGASYPPELHFRTLSTDRVSVHYHQGFEPMAQLAAPMATEILTTLEERYRHRVGRVHIVLVDANDDPNGFSTPLPFPLVTIRAVSPDGTDEFGNLEGWLRLALTHELTHTVHLDEARGIFAFGRKIFGRSPFFFPNTLSMSWMIEGLAVYEETQGTAFGRGRNPDSRMVVRTAALEDRFVKDDQSIYALDAWPAGQASYLFGEYFLRRLSDASGEDTLPRMARQYAGQIIPFYDGRMVKKVTGGGLQSQWNEFGQAEAKAAAEQREARRTQGRAESEALTTRGIRQGSPRYSPDGKWVAYTSQTLTRFPEIRLVRPDGSEDHRLVRRNGGTGLSWTPDGKEIVYSEAQVHKTFSIFYDLSVVDVATRRVRRLTRGLRASDADVSPNGKTIAFARKMGDRAELFTIGRDGKGLAPLTRSDAGVQWSGPRWSPKGDAVAAARLLPGGWLDVVVVDATTGALQDVVTSDRAKDVEPTWTPDGAAVVFRSDREGNSNLYAFRLADRSLVKVTNEIGGAFQPTVSPDGQGVAFAAYSARGFDIHAAPLALAEAPAAVPWVDELPAPRPDPAPIPGPGKPYRPWSMMLPRSWTPWVDLGGSQDRFGLVTGGSDALFRNLWALTALYGTESRQVDWNAYYVYDRFRPTILASAQEQTDFYAQGNVRKREANLQVALPLRRTIRSVQTLSVGYRWERDGAAGATPEERLDLGGIETAWTLSSARTYPYSISPSEGSLLSVAWLREAKGLGSDLDLDKFAVDARGYLRVLGDRDILALRGQGGFTSGAPGFERSFAVGGYPDASLFDIVRTNPAVLRGYPENAFTGRSFVAANASYRFPLFSPQRGWHSFPLFLRHFFGGVFVDTADAFSGSLRLADLKTSAGASVGIDTAISYTLPVTAELTVARGFDELGETKVYFRLGLAF